MFVLCVLYSKEKGANQDKETSKEKSTKKEKDIESRKKTSGGILENVHVT